MLKRNFSWSLSLFSSVTGWWQKAVSCLQDTPHKHNVPKHTGFTAEHVKVWGKRLRCHTLKQWAVKECIEVHCLELCPQGSFLFRSTQLEFCVILPWGLDESIIRTCPNMFFKTRMFCLSTCHAYAALYVTCSANMADSLCPTKTLLHPFIHPSIPGRQSLWQRLPQQSIIHSWAAFMTPVRCWLLESTTQMCPDRASVCVCEWHLAPWQKWVEEIAWCVEAFQRLFG